MIQEASASIAEVEREMGRQRDTRALSMSQFLSLFHEDEPVGLRELGTEQVRQVLCAGMAMALYCQKNDCVHHMFRRVSWIENCTLHI